MRDKRKTATALSQDLDYYIYDMKTGPSLMSFRMSMIDSTEEKQMEMKAKMVDFQKTINKLFSLTGKHIEIEGSKFTVVTDYGTLLPASLVFCVADFTDFATSVPAERQRSRGNDR